MGNNALMQQVEKFWKTDFAGAMCTSKVAMSVEDKKALEMLERSVKKDDGHYQVALPWKHQTPYLPNNRSMAERRLYLLKKRFLRDKELFDKYKSTMNDYLRKGYAKRVPERELDAKGKPLWYLPHHPVFNENKPGKTRVVFDCAAKYKGTSLNDELLHGPDLTNSVVGVLTRFRQEPVALVADIEAMFHQARVKPDDRDALRFLWWPENDLSQDPVDYRMEVHLFGATSSPTCSNFCLRRTASDNREDYKEEVVSTVERNFYVDDCLKSVRSNEEAIKLATDLSELLAKGGFRLTKWLSNKTKVIEAIPESERAKSVLDLDLDNDKLPVDRTLGVQWDLETDKFKFKVVIKDKPTTRRGILSSTSSVYDPLGFLAPVVLRAKKLLQDLCKLKLGWDEPIEEDKIQRWKGWLIDLPKLSQIKVDRFIKPLHFGEGIKHVQLHHFADASQIAYGAASYLRLVDVDDKIHCAFLMSKSRLAHIKPMTIPRLELSAAVLAVQLDEVLKEELELAIDESVFWSDSTTVLQYIRNESKRFQTFVANRLGIIHEGSKPYQWRYVNTELNPADDASRGLTVNQMIENDRWLNGPGFLWKEEDCWPIEPCNLNTVPGDDPEVKKEVQSHTVTQQTRDHSLDLMIRRYSSWDKLKKGIAWLLRFKEFMLRKHCLHKFKGDVSNKSSRYGELTVQEMQVAEKEIIKYVQQQSFPEVISVLESLDPRKSRRERRRTLKNSRSSILNLNPTLDNEGMLRVGGRLENASIGYESKHQMVIPYRHHLTDLIIMHHHKSSGHLGQEYVLSSLRQTYWITKGRSAVRRVIGDCFLCRKQSAIRGEQFMANLPQDRLTPDEPPFTNVGVDFFGPLYVKQGRSHVKRYGCLFTCLTTRAVHIEVASSLETDAFINALRRFINRRGYPKQIRSDNGTNLCGGEREIREALEVWNQRKIGDFLRQRNITWMFNPPTASHMGGIWERMIRSVRKVLRVLLGERLVSDEMLRTLMSEVEGILNSRPLTPNSSDPRDSEPLTPNHLLLLQSNLNLPPGVFTKEDEYCRRRWRQVQYLADIFWERWTREYLPNLQERQKWMKPRRNFAVGDLVLIVDERVHRGQWPLGRIVEVHAGKDGFVRSVKVATKATTLLRPITKLCFLECDKSSLKDNV